MIRALWFLAKLSLALAGVLWLAYHPGEVTVSWLGYHVEVAAGFAAALLLLLVTITAQLYRLWRGFVSVPKILRRYNEAKMRENGYRAVTKGLVSVAAGDGHAALRYARRAQKLLPDYALTRLLVAQAAQMHGDSQTARLEFQSLMEDKDAAFFGVRGLLNEAVRSGDAEEALTVMRKAEKLQPRRGWILLTLFENETRAGQWDKAEQTLSKAVKTGALDRATGHRHRLALLVARAQNSRARGLLPAAIGMAKKAFRLDPSFVPASALFAQLLIQTGKQRAAIKVVEQGWKANPHPDLLTLWDDLMPEKKSGATNLARFSWLRRLHSLTPENPLSAKALGQAALEAGLWGDARLQLQAARAYKLLARLEETENGDTKAARRWLELAADEDKCPVWTCDNCGHIAPSWEALCTRCGAFDTLLWRVPQTALRRIDPAQTGVAEILEPPQWKRFMNG